VSAGRRRIEGTGGTALREIRRARRERYVERLDVMEVLYRVYAVAIFGALALGLIGGAIDEAPATPTAIDSLRDHGPAAIGAVIALAVLAGLRTGARGGPLAIEAAEVQYVLLAPVSRTAALRPLAVRQLRVGALVGAGVGAVIGNFVFRRLPGSPVEWIACLALFGALLPLCFLGAALLASGRRLSTRAAALAGLLLLAWSGADFATARTTSPATALGFLATLPLQSGLRVALAGLGLALALALLGVGLLKVGDILLEAARRRAALTAELRFSASVQDLRTVVLLRRQLASERPRRSPWLRVRARGGRLAVWRRGLQSFLRWPAVRVMRAVLIGVASGALAAGAWSAATPALLVPGLLLFVAGLDLVEPLAQEFDRPTRRRLLPVTAASLIRRQLVAPAVAIAIVLLIATATAALVGGSVPALGIGLAFSAPLALGLACCAAFSATNDPYEFITAPPEFGYAVSAAPAAAAALLVGVPLILARTAESHGGSAVSAALQLALPIALMAAAAVPLLAWRLAGQGSVKA
jgi:hypothetical protein